MFYVIPHLPNVLKLSRYHCDVQLMHCSTHKPKYTFSSMCWSNENFTLSTLAFIGTTIFQISRESIILSSFKEFTKRHMSTDFFSLLVYWAQCIGEWHVIYTTPLCISTEQQPTNIKQRFSVSINAFCL